MVKIFPKGNIKKIQGNCIVLTGDDIDTDRIIPARYLKCVNFNALGNQVFADDRLEQKGRHPFDRDIYNDASILIVNDNFGCGSSREHAPQALMRWGIRALIGQSFAEIFYGNCLALGIPCVTSNSEQIKEIQEIAQANNKSEWELNINDKIFSDNLHRYSINIENGPREMLLTGKWDATSQLISQETALNKKISSLPYLNHFL